MTSRVRRIVLAMYGHQRYEVPDLAEALARIDAAVLPSEQRRRCYEAMDEPDETLVVTRGNFGLPCA